MSVRVLQTRTVGIGQTVIVARSGWIWQLAGGQAPSGRGRFQFSPGRWIVRIENCALLALDGDPDSYPSPVNYFEGEMQVGTDDPDLFCYGPSDDTQSGSIWFYQVPDYVDDAFPQGDGFVDVVPPPDHPPLELEAEFIALARKFGMDLRPPTPDYFDDDPDGDWEDDLDFVEDAPLDDHDIFPGAPKEDDHDEVIEPGPAPDHDQPEPGGADVPPGSPEDGEGSEPEPGRGQRRLPGSPDPADESDLTDESGST